MGGAPLAYYDWRGDSGAIGGFMPGGAAAGPKLETYLYVGGAPPGIAARCLGGNGELQIYADLEWLGVDPVAIDAGAGTFSLTTGAMPSGATTAQSGGKPYIGTCLSTRRCYSATNGLWEVCLRGVPLDQVGTWLTHWLLPTTKTPLNGGQSTEFDILEQLGNRINASLGGRESAATLHGRHIDATVTCSQDGSTTMTVTDAGASPAIQAGSVCSLTSQVVVQQLSGATGGAGTYQMSGARTFASTAGVYLSRGTTVPLKAGNTFAVTDHAFHVFGGLVTPDTIAFYFDGALIASTANAGETAMTDDHYAVLSLAAGGSDYPYPGAPNATHNNVLSPTVNQQADVKWWRHYPLIGG